jgi:hypothetical protein
VCCARQSGAKGTRTREQAKKRKNTRTREKAKKGERVTDQVCCAGLGNEAGHDRGSVDNGVCLPAVPLVEGVPARRQTERERERMSVREMNLATAANRTPKKGHRERAPKKEQTHEMVVAGVLNGAVTRETRENQRTKHIIKGKRTRWWWWVC